MEIDTLGHFLQILHQPFHIEFGSGMRRGVLA